MDMHVRIRVTSRNKFQSESVLHCSKSDFTFPQIHITHKQVWVLKIWLEFNFVSYSTSYNEKYYYEQRTPKVVWSGRRIDRKDSIIVCIPLRSIDSNRDCRFLIKERRTTTKIYLRLRALRKFEWKRSPRRKKTRWRTMLSNTQPNKYYENNLIPHEMCSVQWT